MKRCARTDCRCSAISGSNYCFAHRPRLVPRKRSWLSRLLGV